MSVAVKEGPSVATAAAKALADAGGDVQRATKLFERRVRDNHALRDALTEPLISQACYDAIRGVLHSARQKVWKPGKERLVPAGPGRVAGVVRVVHLAAGNLLTFPLPTGKHLGEATRPDIEKAASFYAAQACDMGAKARWLQLVLQSLPGGKKVADVLTDKRLRELQAEASRDE